jgi:hypothetical protein
MRGLEFNMQLLDSPAYVAVAAISALLLFLWPRHDNISRRGITPGPFGLTTWPARIYFLLKGYKITKEAYRHAKNTPYRLQTLVHDRLILPPKYLPELRMQPATRLSASKALVESILGRYSGVGVILKDRQLNDIARVQLTKSLR